MIVFHDVSKIYQVGDSEVRALDHVSMRIEEGEFVAIVGPSGSGKSTMMNIIGCLDTADSGTYLLDGQAIEEYSEKDLTRIRSQKIGFIFQSFNLIGTMTAIENVELPLIYQKVPKQERHDRAMEALEQVGLADRAAHKPNELSGGQQQRVAIARAIATKPSLFLADEPTGNLDSRTGHDIMNLFQEMHEQGNTVVLITHDENVAKRAARSIHIFDGRIVDGGIDPAELEAIYGLEPAEVPDAGEGAEHGNGEAGRHVAGPVDEADPIDAIEGVADNTEPIFDDYYGEDLRDLASDDGVGAESGGPEDFYGEDLRDTVVIDADATVAQDSGSDGGAPGGSGSDSSGFEGQTGPDETEVVDR